MLGISYKEHKTNQYVWKRVNILAGCQELLLSTVASCHGSAMSAVMMRCRKSCYKKRWMAVVAEEDRVKHGRTTLRDGWASQCRHCCASRTTEVDGQHHNYEASQCNSFAQSTKLWNFIELWNSKAVYIQSHGLNFGFEIPFASYFKGRLTPVLNLLSIRSTQYDTLDFSQRQTIVFWVNF